ncbi:proteoglycan 4-like isoform X2 [Portunus trituberculatus]|nr:proteoglycan 4-like isoform X2 [Portunus trituberculatus]
MCCALYNLCCFRETFRISSSKTTKQEPVSFPIVHRFQVNSPTPEQTSRIPGSKPAPRPSFQPAQQNQNSPRRPTLSKKPFRPSQSEGFKKLPEDDNTDDSKKSISHPKFSSLLNKNAAETRVTRRPAGVDIRQEVIVPEVLEAEPMGGSQRLDASINPVVTRKRLLVNHEPRQPRLQVEESEPEERGPRGRRLQDTPSREGRKLSGGRSTSRPAPPQSSRPSAPTQSNRPSAPPQSNRPSAPPQSNRPSAPPQSNRPAASQQSTRSQPAAPAIPAVPSTKTPAKAPPTSPQPAQAETPKTTTEVKPSAAPATAEPVKESESPDVEAEASETIDTIVSTVQEASDTPANPTLTSPAAKEGATAETNPEAGEETTPEILSEPAETKTETDAAEPVETAANTAFTPPEIEVDIPEIPKVTNPRAEEPAATKEPAQERGSTRSTGARGQSQSRNEEPTQERSRTTSRGQNGDRTTSRTASQSTVRDNTDTAHQSQVRGRSRTRS